MTRHLPRLGVVAVAGLTFVAGCGSGGSGGEAKVASVGGAGGATTTTTAAGDASKADVQEAMLDFAKCMREHGVDMPDPQFSDDGAGGGFTVQEGPAGEADRAEMDEARKACQSIMDKIESSLPPPDPARVEEAKQQMLAFAECMREHGIDMPDPQIDTDGGGIRVQAGGPGMDPDSPGFMEANEACSKEAGLPGVGAIDSGPGPAEEKP